MQNCRCEFPLVSALSPPPSSHSHHRALVLRVLYLRFARVVCYVLGRGKSANNLPLAREISLEMTFVANKRGRECVPVCSKKNLRYFDRSFPRHIAETSRFLGNLSPRDVRFIFFFHQITRRFVIAALFVECFRVSAPLFT